MSDDSLIPISDEQAKLGQDLVKAVRDASGYFTDILGDLPKDLIGLLVGDRVKAKRIEKIEKLWQKTRERMRDGGIADPEPPSLKYAIPILQAVADEENEDLQDLWSRLLAAAMDPNRRDAMRQSFIRVVKQMDPIDALVLKAIRDQGGVNWEPAARDVIASMLKCSSDEVTVSFEHLAELDCISLSVREPYMKPFGTVLMNVVSD
jgi:Abortive infection alpha